MFLVILNDDGRRELLGRTDDESVARRAAEWLAHCGHRCILRSPLTDVVY